MRKTLSVIVLVSLLAGVLLSAIEIRTVRADGNIFINADGSITPSTAPISTVDNITYTFTSDIIGQFFVERNNTVLDGAGHTVRKGSIGSNMGVCLGIFSSIDNVTIKNMTIAGFADGIYLDSSSNNTLSSINITSYTQFGIALENSSNNNTVSGNNATGNGYYGIFLSSSNNNTVQDNNATGYYCGIFLSYSNDNVVFRNNAIGAAYNILLADSSNDWILNNSASAGGEGIVVSACSNITVSGNNLTENYWGFDLDTSSYVTASDNNVTGSSQYGIHLASSSNNTIYHNNFINNTQQVYSNNSVNAWDNSYPSGGNYWSNYGGVDLYSGLYQNQTGSDGIGDTPYVIDGNNQDNYPLMKPWSSSRSTSAVTTGGGCGPGGLAYMK